MSNDNDCYAVYRLGGTARYPNKHLIATCANRQEAIETRRGLLAKPENAGHTYSIEPVAGRPEPPKRQYNTAIDRR